MPKAKKPKSKTKKDTSINGNVAALLKAHKLLVVLSAILLLVISGYAYNAYKDWENAQFIKGLVQDFPQLVSDIETATGLELEIKKDCSITTEKYSSGVRTCELSTGYIGITYEEIQNIEKIVSAGVLVKSDYSNYNYKNKNACDLWFADNDRFHLRCITAVREANIDLARELFLAD